MEISSKNDRRAANHIRIYAFACMSSILYFGMMNFKKNGLPYSAITVVALVLYAVAVPLAHVAHLQNTHARSSDMRVVQIITFKWLMESLTALLTLLFLGPAVYGGYIIFCQDGTLGAKCNTSTPSTQLSRHALLCGVAALLAVDYAALITSLAMLLTPHSFTKGSFNRSISFAFVLTSLGMLVNTYSLIHVPTEWAWWESVQGFAEGILGTTLSLLVAFFLSMTMVSIAEAYESLPEKELEADSEPLISLSSK